MSDERIKIQCPECGQFGKARPEHINKRVSCKKCNHIFKVVPYVEATAAPAAKPPGSAAAARHEARQRLTALEGELQQVRDALSAQSAEHPAYGWAEAEVEKLRDQLTQSQELTRKLEKQLREAQTAQARSDQAVLEAQTLREQLHQARATHVGVEQDLLQQVADLREQLDGTIGTEPKSDQSPALEAQVRALEEDLAQARSLATESHQAIEAHAQAIRDHEARRLELVEHHDREIQSLRQDRDETRAALEARPVETDRAEIQEELDQLRAELANDREASQKQRDEAAWLAGESRARIEELTTDRDRARADLEDQARSLRDERDQARSRLDEMAGELETLRGLSREVESLRAERDQARSESEEIAQELELHQARILEPEGHTADWSLHDPATPVDTETQALRDQLIEAQSQIDEKDAALAERTEERDRSDAARLSLDAEVEKLRQSLVESQATAETAHQAVEALRQEGEALKAASIVAASAPAVPVASMADSPEFKAAVALAVQNAWPEIEARMSKIQVELKSEKYRTVILEDQVRETQKQLKAYEGLMNSSGSSSIEISQTILGIGGRRGVVKLTSADAEARLAQAQQLANDRRDRPLLNRIKAIAERVREDLEAKNVTLAETLIRGVEIEVGLDPGGYSIKNLRLFRPSPTIVASLEAMAAGFDRVMQKGDLALIRSTIGEMRTILGDQAGLPEIRRIGRTPVVKRQIGRPEAVRLFLDALEAESWLMTPITSDRPLPDTSLSTYACLVDACVEVRPLAKEFTPDRLKRLDQVIEACLKTVLRRQQPDGHFAFLDPRGRASRLASMVGEMVARSPGAVRDGWVIGIDPAGVAQTETSYCALAALKAGSALKRSEWTQSAMKAADWAAAQPCVAQFPANAASASLLARTYLESKQGRHLDALVAKLTLGLLPAQVENGRWIDATSAQLPHHLSILRALHDAWEALPADRGPLRAELKESLEKAIATLLEESEALGVPTQGGALRDLIRHRDLAPTAIDPRLEPAIVDSATVVQDLCHDGIRPKLGVSPDLLATLVLV